jgi:hypothetical protein
MALRKQITLKNNFGDNVTFNEAYIKVEALIGDKTQMRVDVAVHKKQGEQVVDRKNYFFTPNLDGSNFIAQAYDYIKFQPDFTGAVDC